MAENFVYPNDSKRVEDKGDEYIFQLLSRSFLEPVDESTVVMHDLMHDLTQGISGKFSARQDHESMLKVHERTRHFSYHSGKYDTITKFQAIGKTEFLRSLFRQNIYSFGSSYLTNKLSNDIIGRLHCLRVLSLPGYENFSLPESISCLKLLRYLDVSHSDVKNLPESVSMLNNLQTLVLSKCENLESLPEGTWKLGSLRHLDIRGTTLLSHMPKEMSKLKSLQTLTDFVVGKDVGSGIQELKDLQEIRGRLALRRLQNLCVKSDAFAFDLTRRKFIDDLELEFDAEENNDSEKDRNVLEILKPPSTLKKLTITNYAGTRFPKWLNLGCAVHKSLTFLCLSGCCYCYSLPHLGQLPSLKKLEIERMDHIIVVGHEFYGHNNSSCPFPALEDLSFKKMDKWELWSNVDSEGGAICFPRLEKLSLCECPKLTGDLPLHVPSLVQLEIDGCAQLQYSSLRFLPWMASVSAMQSVTFPCPHAELTKAFGVTSITKLILVRLVHLLELPAQLAQLPYLISLEIIECQSLKSLSNVVVPSQLVSLNIQVCRVLESLPKCMTSLCNLKRLILSHCPRLRWVPVDTLPTSLIYLTVSECESWEFPIPIERMHNTSLEHLRFEREGSHLVSFPLGVFPNLRSLSFMRCQGLEKVYIPEGFEDNMLTSLLTLSITSCPKLEMIGKDRGRGEGTILPASNLTHLGIYGCIKVRPVLIEVEGEVLLPKLGILELHKLNKLISEWPLNLRRSLFRFSCLTHLTINGEEVECFPVANEGWGSLPTSLWYLYLQDCPKLRRLDGKALQTLTCLEYLGIEDCPNLECLPEEGLPPSLSSLSIRECPMVEERCQPEKGKDWCKISHIPKVQLSLD